MDNDDHYLQLEDGTTFNVGKAIGRALEFKNHQVITEDQHSQVIKLQLAEAYSERRILRSEIHRRLQRKIQLMP